MSILKRFSLAAALLTFAGCTSSSNQYAVDEYYTDDFAIEVAPAQQAKPVEQKARTKAAPAAQKNRAEMSSHAQAGQTITEISKKVAADDAKLRQIQENIRKNSDLFTALKSKSADESRQYYEYIARIFARLQIGTTPGNPELTEMWKQASALLAGTDKNIAETAKLSSETIRTKNELDSLLDTISETFQIPGAMEADHENLRTLEDEANQTMVSLNRLSSDLSAQIARQQQYFSTERQNINTLETDIQNGKMFSTGQTGAMIPAIPLLSPITDLPEANLAGRRPLMVIRFNKSKIDYEQSLYKAVKAALEKRPGTSFEIVAVSPAQSISGEVEAVRNADAVRDSLTAMGLPATRIYSSKTKSASIKTTEVHLYLK